MNFFRSPWVTGCLVFIAVAVVWYQIYSPRPPIERTVEESLPAPVTPLSPQKDPTTPPKLLVATPEPQEAVDREFVSSQMPGWIASPVRDPFRLVSIAGQIDSFSPIAKWKLKAVWLQDGTSLAAINQGVYSEGDIIEGYKIERIEGGQVWFVGPKSRERLGFDKWEAVSGLPPDTNAVPQNAPDKPDTSAPPAATNSTTTNQGHAE